MTLIDGKKTAADIKNELEKEVIALREDGRRPPHLAAIIVGSNGASLTYVNAKMKSCEKVGFASSVIHLDESITEEDLLKEVQKLNDNDQVDGFIVQLPLPKHINEETVIFAVDPKKDVDGFHPTNFGKMALELPSFISATPYGIVELLKRYNIETKGKNAVVIGRSRIVGKPISLLLGSNAEPGNCTVTTVHSKTQNIEEFTRNADIIITALGVPNFLKADMVKEGAVVIDVGITRVTDESPKGYTIIGDVDFDDVSPKCSYITPVPGGVGPMTIAMLMKNTLKAYLD